MVLEALRDTQKGLPDDKLRMFLVFYLFTDTIAASDLEEYETALTAAGCSTAPLRYLKQYTPSFLLCCSVCLSFNSTKFR